MAPVQPDVSGRNIPPSWRRAVGQGGDRTQNRSPFDAQGRVGRGLRGGGHPFNRWTNQAGRLREQVVNRGSGRREVGTERQDRAGQDERLAGRGGPTGGMEPHRVGELRWAAKPHRPEWRNQPSPRLPTAWPRATCSQEDHVDAKGEVKPDQRETSNNDGSTSSGSFADELGGHGAGPAPPPPPPPPPPPEFCRYGGAASAVRAFVAGRRGARWKDLNDNVTSWPNKKPDRTQCATSPRVTNRGGGQGGRPSPEITVGRQGRGARAQRTRSNTIGRTALLSFAGTRSPRWAREGRHRGQARRSKARSGKGLGHMARLTFREVNQMDAQPDRPGGGNVAQGDHRRGQTGVNL